MLEIIQNNCIDMLHDYARMHPDEARVADRIAAFIDGHPDAFSRSCLEGHVTGSAFIATRSRQKVLFVHHAKLLKWLQPGGHCEEGESALEIGRAHV